MLVLEETEYGNQEHSVLSFHLFSKSKNTPK